MLMLNTTPYTVTGVRTILTAVASSKAMCGLCPSVLTVRSQPSQVVTKMELVPAEECPCFYFATCPTEGKHQDD